MKKFFLSALAVALIVSSFFVYRAWAQTATPLINLSNFNGSTNSAPFSVANVYIPNVNFLFSTPNGITNGAGVTNNITNAVVYNIQYSVDNANSNWITVYTFSPFTTNAEADNVAFGQPSNNITLYMRVQAVTTNAITVAAYKR